MTISLKTPVAIVGLGISGESALSLLLTCGVPRHQIITFDEKSTSAQVNDPQKLWDEFHPATLVVSPGVSLKKPWILDFISRGVVVTSEISLAVSCLDKEILIGITGSVGKSTVTSLIGDVLSQIDKTTFVGGNLGTPLCTYVREVLENKRPRAKWIVVELSSYQLENCKGLNLDVAAITSLTPNHLERYDSLESYYRTKFHIIDICHGPTVINLDSSDLKKWQTNIEKSFPLKKLIWSSSLDHHGTFVKARLIGQHNQQNLSLSAGVLLQLGIDQEKIKLLNQFSGLPHRTEFFGTWDDILFINDSKATSVESVLMALNACLPLLPERGKLHLLLGGRDKKLPWQQLSSLSSNKNILFYFFGESRDLIPQQSGLKGISFETLKEGFPLVMKNTKPKDIVLFSPGGTSLDQFKNFEDRGNYFKNLVRTHYSSR